MLEAGLAVTRFLHFAATLTLFGLSSFTIYTYRRRTDEVQPHLQLWLKLAMWWAAAAAFVGAAFWFFSVVASITGSFAESLDRETIWVVLADTSFGRVWTARLVLAGTILLFLTARAKILSGGWLMPVLCAGLLVSLAGVGHTQIDDGTAWFIHMSADALHLLAAGAWLGGPVSLFYLVGPSAGKSPASDAEATHAALRFSAMGYVAVAAVIGTGLLNSWYLVGSFANLATPYGQLLVIKVGLIGAMIGFAGLNRFWIVPRLISVRGTGGRSAELAKLRRHIVGEQALGILIILIVGALGTMQPAINPP